MTEGKVTATTTNSITVTAKAKDAAGTVNGHYKEESGIKQIIFELTGTISGKQQTLTEPKSVSVTGTTEASASHTFTGLTQGQTYTITAKAVDKAGNVSPIKTISGGNTGTVPGGSSAAISFSPDKTNWTNGVVNVTIASTYTAQDKGGYELQYKTTISGSTDWQDYTTPVKMTTNGTIYARLKDSTNQMGAQATATQVISIIDTQAPGAPTGVTASAVAGTTTNGKKHCITVTATAQDTAATTTKPGEQSGIDKIQFKIDSGAWQDVSASTTGTAQVNKSYTSGALKTGSHTIKVKAIDKAGNESSEVSASNVSIDATNPSAPKIEVISGTLKAGTTNTYTSAITVKITPGTDTVGVKDTTYSVTGQTTNSGTLTGNTTKELTFSNNGTYTISATTTDTSGNTASSSLTVTKAGTPPTVTASADRSYDNGTHKITITATGNDAEGGTLTYTVSYGTSTAYGTTKTVTGTAGQPVTITIDSGLDMATAYYYKVDVKDTDNTFAQTPYTNSVKTYCVAASCGGGHTESHNCTTCGGSGYTYVTCSGEYYFYSTWYTVPRGSYPYCRRCFTYYGGGDVITLAHAKCSTCGADINVGYYCSTCDPEWPPASHTRSTKCSASGCNNGKVYETVQCEHKQNSAHLYCPTTGKVVSSELHDD